MWIKHILLSVLPLFISNVVALECYDCVGTSSPTSCNTTRICNDNQACFVQSKHSSSGMTFDMGCRGIQECGAAHNHSGVLIIGRSVITRRQAGTCLECCSSDMCNSQLCHHDKPSACVDDERVDCAMMNSLFNICDDIHQAQKVCSKSCNLCNIVDGNWSSWNTWSSCDVTCGNGTHTRVRTCTNPAPAYGGLNCSGIGEENKQCVKELCPVHGGWSLWTSWGTCSVSCGVGLQRRDRSCSLPYPARNGDHCFGDARDDRVCIERPCADGGWSDWGGWKTCTATCGGGITRRHRQCDNPRPSTFGHACIGSEEQTNICNTVQCSFDGNWSPWNTWSACDVTCGNGTQTRIRTCTSPAPAYGGLNCSGTGVENKQCVKELCPVHGGWSLWTSWGTCSVSCGVGLQRRNRSCSSPYPSQHGNHCVGDARDDRVCIERPCTDGGWSDWGSWEPCTAVCDGGITRRHRQCDSPRPSTFGHACIGNAEQTNICNTVQCPSDCYEIKQHNKAATSGVYKLRIIGVTETVLVYCDMDTDGGGWTVFQRRINGTADFYRTFKEYEIGFGNINGEFWLGLKYIQQMTAVSPSELRLDLTAADDSTAYEVFKNFSLSAGPAYTLHIAKGTGTAGDSKGLSYNNGHDFYTKDHDNQYGCAVDRHGGWWYYKCAYVNLNGDYVTPGTQSHYGGGYGGVVYYNFKYTYNSLKRTQMMFRKL